MTVADSTPSILTNADCTVALHDPQVMPSIFREIVWSSAELVAATFSVEVSLVASELSSVLQEVRHKVRPAKLTKIREVVFIIRVCAD